MSKPLRLRLRLASCRAAGIDFETAWRRSIYTGKELPGAPKIGFYNGDDSRTWREAFEATKDGWRAAYEREPDPRVERLARITPVLGELSLTPA